MGEVAQSNGERGPPSRAGTSGCVGKAKRSGVPVKGRGQTESWVKPIFRMFPAFFL